MYGLPRDTDLSFFEGAVLTQVCIGENEVIIHFDNDAGITIQSSVRLSDGERTRIFEGAPDTGVALVRLLGQAVATAAVEPGGVTRLEWRSGTALRILDSWAEYESYVITHDGKTIVV
jgi:hypothetical protein